MFRNWLLVVLSVWTLTACAGPASAPGSYDRPAVVRAPARVGSVVGGVTGIFAAVVFWPIGKGLNYVFDEPLGYSEREWSLLPISTMAAVGHYALGLPGEVLHFLFYGAWVTPSAPVGFHHVPTVESAAAAGR